jgi:DNA polymerase I-like protein with 3'-5' exonuclease and polymerase domains
MLFTPEQFGSLKKTVNIKSPPPIPNNGWRPPSYLPDLRDAVVISFDTETYEPDFDHGPGWGRSKGNMVGVSICAEDRLGNRGTWYFPLRHTVQPEFNLSPQVVIPWLKAQLETPHIPKVGANLLYDVGWLTTENIYVQGELHDVQFAEALLNEDGYVSLDYLGNKYLREGKETNELYVWMADSYGGEPSHKQRANIWRAPPALVGPYAESDAYLPLDIIRKQLPLLEAENLMDVYKMECASIPLLTQMRMTGVNININAAQQLFDELSGDISALNHRLYKETGVWASVDNANDLSKIFDKLGIKYKRTVKGKPSFTKDFLNIIEHPVADLIREIREHEKIRNVFLRSYLLESNVAGRVHCQFHPLRGDRGGTRSGRFSSDTPNLQNIPVRTALGKKVRKLFIPDNGHLCIDKNDYSQIEYRFLAHFAVGTGADEVRRRYNTDPKTDYHQMTQELVKMIAGLVIDRKPIKNINFGLLYGMGEKKLTKQIGVDRKTANDIFAAYHKGNPYVKATMDAAASEAELTGYITTILGRRSRFDWWEPSVIDYDDRKPPLRRDKALDTYGAGIRRAQTHKAINRRLQGSAADMIKKGMIRCHREGVFDVIGVPKLQVHDELVFSVIDRSPQQDEAYKYMRHVLETAIPLNIPVIVDSGRGPNWGEID